MYIYIYTKIQRYKDEHGINSCHPQLGSLRAKATTRKLAVGWPNRGGQLVPCRDQLVSPMIFIGINGELYD